MPTFVLLLPGILLASLLVWSLLLSGPKRPSRRELEHQVTMLEATIQEYERPHDSTYGHRTTHNPINLTQTPPSPPKYVSTDISILGYIPREKTERTFGIQGAIGVQGSLDDPSPQIRRFDLSPWMPGASLLITKPYDIQDQYQVVLVHRPEH